MGKGVLMMFGFMLIEIESLDELKLLTSGNGLIVIVLRKLRWIVEVLYSLGLLLFCYL